MLVTPLGVGGRRGIANIGAMGGVCALCSFTANRARGMH